MPIKRNKTYSVSIQQTEKGPDVFDYLDYRAFLRDYYLDRKKRRGLSFRGFSKRAGLKSPNYLKLVIDGQRNLTDAMAERFARAVGLEGEGEAYFSELVRFDQARSSAERGTHYAKITGFRQYRKARPLEVAHAAYHSTWYLPAVRELAARPDFRDDPSWIAATLWPPISTSDAERALASLLELGLLVRGDDGKVCLGESLLSTGPEVQGVNVANYHRMMLERAAQAIDDVPAALRDISSLTMCLGQGGIARLKERIRRFRRELLELSAIEPCPEQVVQVNFQLFPLSRSTESPE